MPSYPNVLAVVLAAGQGTRMKSDLPKVLVPALGRPMVDWVLDAIDAAGIPRSVVVIGYEADLVRQALAARKNVSFALQAEQLGTGHAVMMCRDQLAEHDGPVLVVAGDSPLLQISSLVSLLELFEKERPACILGTQRREDPAGLGRIVRDEHGAFLGIVEEKDATEAQRKITEVNMSTYVFDCQAMLGALDGLSNDNRQQEYYITDCPGILKAAGCDVRALPALQPCEALSVNTVEDLAAVETEMKRLGYAI